MSATWYNSLNVNCHVQKNGGSDHSCLHCTRAIGLLTLFEKTLLHFCVYCQAHKGSTRGDIYVLGRERRELRLHTVCIQHGLSSVFRVCKGFTSTGFRFLNMLVSLSLHISSMCYLNLAGQSAGIPQVVFLGIVPGIWGNILLLHVLIGSWVYSLY